MLWLLLALAGAIPADIDRLVVVRASDWDAPRGELMRFERAARGWRAMAPAVRAELGAHGLAWGLGLHAVDDKGPRKQEGDGRTPAGLFAVGEAFGYAERPEGVELVWRRVGKGDVCVDDPKSKHYNRLARDEDKDWASAEVMRRTDALYELGAVIEHNADAVPGAGSCIFFHVARRRGAPTVGCVALRRADMLWLLRWMKPGRTAVVVLPEAVYQALRPAWGLPP